MHLYGNWCPWICLFICATSSPIVGLCKANIAFHRTTTAHALSLQFMTNRKYKRKLWKSWNQTRSHLIITYYSAMNSRGKILILRAYQKQRYCSISNNKSGSQKKFPLHGVLIISFKLQKSNIWPAVPKHLRMFTSSYKSVNLALFKVLFSGQSVSRFFSILWFSLI